VVAFAEYPLTTQPYLQNPGRTQMTVMWTSDVCGEGLLRFGSGGRVDRTVHVRPRRIRYGTHRRPRGVRLADLPAGQVATACVYKARLTRLAAGTKYDYEVRFDGRSHRSHFRTFPRGAEPFRFAVYGDNHCRTAVHRRIARAAARHAPAFLIHLGDMVTWDLYDEYVSCFLRPLAGVADRIPVFSARGNHQIAGRQYRNVCDLPAGRFWYSFDHGDAHFLCVDSATWRWPDAEPRTAEMLQWCEADLAASSALWKIVYFHEPCYDMAWDRGNWGRSDFLPMFRRRGVDLAFSGHSHCYMRFRPMYWPGENDAHPITYVVSGGAGGMPRTPRRAKPHLVVGSRRHHYCLCRVDGPRLSVEALTPEGRRIDAFELTKTDGRPSPAYVSRAVEEETFAALEAGLRRVRLAALPRKGREFVVPLTLHAASRPVRFRIETSRASGRFYEVLRPVRGRIPAGGCVERTVRLRARVDARTRGRSPVVRPLLILECHYQAAGRRGVVSANWATVRRQEAIL
jgi:hypothetical protein